MLSEQDFLKISQTRLEEAKILFSNGLYDGSVYLAGYALEAALKGRICKILDSDYPPSGDAFRSFYTHKFDTLIKLAALEKKLDEAKVLSSNFATNWSLATSWTEANRYLRIGSKTKAEAADVLASLEDPTDGILTWIKKVW